MTSKGSHINSNSKECIAMHANYFKRLYSSALVLKHFNKVVLSEIITVKLKAVFICVTMHSPTYLYN